jgi:hypothetical protein
MLLGDDLVLKTLELVVIATLPKYTLDSQLQRISDQTFEELKNYHWVSAEMQILYHIWYYVFIDLFTVELVFNDSNTVLVSFCLGYGR